MFILNQFCFSIGEMIRSWNGRSAMWGIAQDRFGWGQPPIGSPSGTGDSAPLSARRLL